MPANDDWPVWALMITIIVSACSGPSQVLPTDSAPAPVTSSPDSPASSRSTSTSRIATTVPVSPPSGEPFADRGEPLPDDAEPVGVSSIIDGDTIRVGVGRSRYAPVRLIGINAPEAGECYADEATQALAALVPVGTVVGLTRDVSDVDEFGRLLRYVWRGGMSVNEEMVRGGAAIARRYPPDTAMAESLELAQIEAAEAQRGLWDPGACGPHSDAVLVIAELEYDAPGDDTSNLNEEWIAVRNDGQDPLDLTGWSIRDESAGNRYRFPGSFTLAPGETVKVRSGCGDDSATDLFWCSVGAAIWDNDGDTAFLIDPNGNTHTRSSYQGS